MKYMILHYGSQADYDAMAGRDTPAGRAWTPEEVTGLGEFMHRWTSELMESGEFVDAKALAGPVHTRRVGGDAVVTDGPYAETAEVVVGYTIVDCASFDRATEIAARLGATPGPEYVRARAYVDVRPFVDDMAEITG